MIHQVTISAATLNGGGKIAFVLPDYVQFIKTARLSVSNSVNHATDLDIARCSLLLNSQSSLVASSLLLSDYQLDNEASVRQFVSEITINADIKASAQHHLVVAVTPEFEAIRYDSPFTNWNANITLTFDYE